MDAKILKKTLIKINKMENHEYITETIKDGSKDFMMRAIELSEQSIVNGTGPFGAVIVDENGQIIAESHNEVTKNNDPTAHAEICAIRNACQKIGNFKLPKCSIYTSCEPCPMCIAAIYWAHIDTVYYGNTREDANEIHFNDNHIYEELQKPLHKRTIRMIPLCRDEALNAFDIWSKKEDKTPY
jgi:guanine deaminase